MKSFLKKLSIAAGVAVMSCSGQAVLDGKIAIDRAINSPTLTVRYSGIKASLVELRINGKSVSSRTVSGKNASGETNFSLSAYQLEQGDNTVEICLFDTAGKLLGSEKTIVTVDAEITGAVYIAGPKPGASVQGPIEVKLGVNRKFGEMYVSFFVDDEWKALRNFPPYNYIWDTTQYSNGWHVVQAWVVDEKSSTLKTEKVRVFVNNPGGRTDRQTSENELGSQPQPTQPDLATSSNPILAKIGEEVTKPLPGGVVVIEPSKATKTVSSGSLSVNPGPSAGFADSTLKSFAYTHPEITALTKSTTSAPAARNLTATMKPTGPLELHSSTLKSSVSLGGTAIYTNPSRPTAPKPTAITANNRIKGATGSSNDLKPAVLADGIRTSQKLLVPTGSRVAKSTTGATANSPKPAAPKPATVAKQQPVATPKLLAKATKTAVAPVATGAKNAIQHVQNIAVTKGQRLPNVGAVTVLVNSTIVEFDVQPRIEKGIPLAPIRHLFEQAGGNVIWQNDKKEITASTAGKQISLQIGQKSATVNKQMITLEKAPFIEEGRTIVPVSFVRESLGVKVEYDPTTGHILIKTKD